MPIKVSPLKHPSPIGKSSCAEELNVVASIKAAIKTNEAQNFFRVFSI
jgi:hypothetical protein